MGMNTQTHDDRASERQIGDIQERAKEVLGAAIQNLGGQRHMSRIALERWNIDTSRLAILSTETSSVVTSKIADDESAPRRRPPNVRPASPQATTPLH